MALPTSGALSIQQIADEFSCADNLNACAKAANISTVNPVSISDFYGKTSDPPYAEFVSGYYHNFNTSGYPVTTDTTVCGFLPSDDNYTGSGNTITVVPGKGTLGNLTDATAGTKASLVLVQENQILIGFGTSNPQVPDDGGHQITLELHCPGGLPSFTYFKFVNTYTGGTYKINKSSFTGPNVDQGVYGWSTINHPFPLINSGGSIRWQLYLE